MKWCELVGRRRVIQGIEYEVTGRKVRGRTDCSVIPTNPNTLHAAKMRMKYRINLCSVEVFDNDAAGEMLKPYFVEVQRA